MAQFYLPLMLYGLVPIALTIMFFFLEKTKVFKKIPRLYQQLIIGIAYGGFCILSTEFGVEIKGAVANIRDVGPLVAGMVFGGPAGIIAGLIGGVERFFAAYWGKGMYSQIACSVSTVLAGFYAAGIRKYMFDDRKPTWGFALAAAGVMEVIHLTILMLTHMSNTAEVIVILKKLALPMIICNASVTCLCLLVLQIIKFNKEEVKKTLFKISTQVQMWLLLLVVVAYTGTTLFINSSQTGSANINAENLLSQTISDLCSNVMDMSDRNLKNLLEGVVTDYQNNSSIDFATLAENNDVSEVHLVNAEGKIIKTNVPEFLNFDMRDSSNSQAYEFDQGILSADEYIQNFKVRSYEEGTDKATYVKYAGKKISSDGSYIQVGLNDTKFKGTLNSFFHDLTAFRHVGKTGFVVILDKDGLLITEAPYILSLNGEMLPIDRSNVGISLETIEEITKNPKSHYKNKIFGLDSYYLYEEIETYHLIVTLPVVEVFETRDAQIYINSFMQVLIYAGLFTLIYFLVKLLVVNNILKINTSLNSIIKGDLSQKINIHSSEEFSSLSNDINFTVDTLKELIDEASKRIDAELAFAKTIQTNSLVNSWPAFPKEKSFDIYATMLTAKEVGGDFYDLYQIDEDNFAFLIADVSGKGIPAAMFMMESKTMLKNFAIAGLSPEEILLKANENLCQGNEANMFVTCWIGILNKKTGLVRFANAGHNYPLIYRKNSGWEIIRQKKNFILGGMEGMPYVLQEVTLNPGDKIYLYTDGVTEATRSDGVLYGENRLLNYLNNNQKLDNKALLEGIQSDIDLFIEGNDQFDDITMLVLDYLGE